MSGSGTPTDLILPATTLTSGSSVYTALNSITNGSLFVVTGSAAVTLTSGNYIHLEPGFHATAGSAATTVDAKIDPNVH